MGSIESTTLTSQASLKLVLMHDWTFVNISMVFLVTDLDYLEGTDYWVKQN